MSIDLSKLVTEKRNPDTYQIDMVSTEGILKMINEEDKKVACCVEKEISSIAKAVDMISDSLEKGGRLIYLGAGTSGRLGILDASECPPTFGTPKGMVQGVIAGGEAAIFNAVEGAEDDFFAAATDLKKIDFRPQDILVGITASGRTPYVLGGAGYAREIGAKSIIVTNNAFSEARQYAELCIEVVVGGEVITGSTRMKAGTAQKMVLNMLTTATMIKLGKTYENLMVDVESTNLKLRERGKNIVMEVTEVDRSVASEFLERTEYDVKLAIFMIKSGFDRTEAERILRLHKGRIRKALKAVGK